MPTGDVLTTARLSLQPLTDQHADALFPIYSHTGALQHWDSPPHLSPQHTALMIAFTLHNAGMRWWTAFHRDTGQAIGAVWYYDSVVPGMGYIVHPDHWRQGYGTEMVSAALDYGFTVLNLNRVELWIVAANLPSQHLARKLGFRQRGQFYQRYDHESEPHEKLVFGLRAAEWTSRQQTRTAPPSEIAFLGVSPHIPVADVSTTMTFYRDRLGFAVDYVGGDPPDFAIVGRGEWSSQRVQLHLTRSTEPPPPGSLYITISPPVDRLHDEFRAQGVTVISPPATQSYGRREFTILDCNGWRITFAAAA